MKQRSWTIEQLTEAVKTSHTITEVAKKLGLVGVGGNHRTINKYIKQLNIDTSHMLGQAWATGKKRPGMGAPIETLLGYRATDGKHLKKRLLAEGLLENRCSKCGIVDWMGEPITLHLDHINGQWDDNRLENLRILCPNCHTQTPTYGNKKRT